MTLPSAVGLPHGILFRQSQNRNSRKFAVASSPPLRYLPPTADFSVVDPQRMMCAYGPAEGSTQPFVHAWLVWVNINAIRCREEGAQRERARGMVAPGPELSALLSGPPPDAATGSFW